MPFKVKFTHRVLFSYSNPILVISDTSLLVDEFFSERDHFSIDFSFRLTIFNHVILQLHQSKALNCRTTTISTKITMMTMTQLPFIQHRRMFRTDRLWTHSTRTMTMMKTIVFPNSQGKFEQFILEIRYSVLRIRLSIS